MGIAVLKHKFFIGDKIKTTKEIASKVHYSSYMVIYCALGPAGASALLCLHHEAYRQLHIDHQIAA
jgi:hypothetical protein